MLQVALRAISKVPFSARWHSHFHTEFLSTRGIRFRSDSFFGGVFYVLFWVKVAFWFGRFGEVIQFYFLTHDKERGKNKKSQINPSKYNLVQFKFCLEVHVQEAWRRKRVC